MSEIKSVRLIEIVRLVPSDVTKGFVKCKSGREIEFTDISQLAMQYQLDTVAGFDIKSNDCGERVLLVWLAHN